LNLAHRLPALNVNAWVDPDALLLARVLLSLSSRLERYEAVIDSVRNWRDVMRGPISPNRIEMLWRDEQVCQALLKSLDALDADPVTGSGGEE
jgi:hypothetical protein